MPVNFIVGYDRRYCKSQIGNMKFRGWLVLRDHSSRRIMRWKGEGGGGKEGGRGGWVDREGGGMEVCQRRPRSNSTTRPNRRCCPSVTTC